jgi:hypothetical protein
MKKERDWVKLTCRAVLSMLQGSVPNTHTHTHTKEVKKRNKRNEKKNTPNKRTRKIYLEHGI